MRMSGFLLWTSACAMAAVASEFPYVEPTVRFQTAGETVVESPVPVAIASAVVPFADSVVVVETKVRDIEFCDEANWADFAATNAAPHGAIAQMRKASDKSVVWMGYSASGWVELSAAGLPKPDDEWDWDLRIELDYSLGAGHDLVRYSVKPSGAAGAYVVLTPSGDKSPWLPLGGAADGDRWMKAVKLDGYGVAKEIVVKGGTRPDPPSGLSVVDECGMDFTALSFDLALSNGWSSALAKMTLKQGGAQVAESNVVFSAADSATVTFSPVAPDSTYAYEVAVTGIYRGVSVTDTVPGSSAIPSSLAKATVQDGTITLTENAVIDLSSVAPGDYEVKMADPSRIRLLTWSDVTEVPGKYAVLADGVLTVMEGYPKNGIDSYVSHVLGLNPDDAADTTYLAESEPSASGKFAFSMPRVDAAKIVRGEKVSFALAYGAEPTCEGGTLQPLGGPSAEVDLATELPGETQVKYFRMRMTFARTSGDAAYDSVNVAGVMKVLTKTENTIVAVPWRELSATGDVKRVDALVRADNLTGGDAIYAYDAGNYRMWTLQDGTWAEALTVKKSGVEDQVNVEPQPDATLPRGRSFWLIRHRPVDEGSNPVPFYLCGQHDAADPDPIVVEPGGEGSPRQTMLANPLARATRLNDLVWTGANAADTIMVPKNSASGAQPILTFENGQWGLWQTEFKAGRFQNVFKTDFEVPIGVGFWYVSRGGTPKVDWKETDGKGEQ